MHKIVFHNNLDVNQQRGFEVYVIVVYSEQVRKNIMETKENYRELIKSIYNENPKGLKIQKIDINPFKSIQSIDIDFPDNAIDCVLISMASKSILKSVNYKISIGKEYLKPEIHVICSKAGINLK